MNNAHPYRLKAMTMAEILFVIVLSAIILSVVWDGVLLFGRHSGNMVARITANSDVFNDYARLESLVVSADSMEAGYGAVELWRGGALHARIAQGDSSVLVSLNGRTDTLFRSLAVLQTVLPDPASPRLDSLRVTIRQREKPALRIAFVPLQPLHREVLEKIEKQEERYRYD